MCPNCGASVTSDAFRCARCGARLLVAAHHAPPATKPKPRPAPKLAAPPPKPHAHHASTPPPNLPVAPLKNARQPLTRRHSRLPTSPAPTAGARFVNIWAVVVLIGVGGLVVFGLANSVFSGVKQVADNSSGVLADGPNASLAQSYTAPDGSFRVTFPGLPEELPSGVSLWNNETHLTHQVVASIGQPLFSRVRYADLSDAEAATDLATFYKSLCRSLGSHPSDSDDLVSGQPAMRCQVDNGTTFDDHELLRHDNRIYDISSTYGPDDIGAADVHDAFVQSFELT